jgi:hypothetical protein
MDEARITITVKPIYIERIVYWIVILVLAVLLVFAYLRDDTSEAPDGTQGGTEDEGPAAPAPSEGTAPPGPVAHEPEQSCGDGVKNRDETDVDCGGSCTGCAAGKACVTADDCAAQYCVASLCTNTAPAQLSGKLDFTLTSVQHSKSGSGTVKVTGIQYKIVNGMGQGTDTFLVRVYVKNKAGTRCLNQQTTGSCDDSYAEFTIPGVGSGKTTEDGHEFSDSDYTTLMGRYLIEDTGYDPSDPNQDDVSVFAYLYDVNGDEIGGKSITSFKTINPS